MANVGAQEAGMGVNATYPARPAPSALTAATNVTATTRPPAIPSTAAANANRDSPAHAVKNTVPKATGVKIATGPVSVPMRTLSVTPYKAVFAVRDLPVIYFTIFVR